MLSKNNNSISVRALENLRSIVKNKTRFECSEILAVSQEDIQQSFQIVSKHKLKAVLVEKKITGNFLRLDALEKLEVDDPKQSAEIESEVRLNLASTNLLSELNESKIKYNHPRLNPCLPAQRKFYMLQTCNTCAGHGKISCGMCVGAGENTCSNCQGDGKVRCTAYNCINGQAICSKCNGTNSISVQVPYQETSWVSNGNGGGYNTYRTVYRTEFRSCDGYGCYGGRVRCQICHATGKVNCVGCDTTGKVICSRCSGSGAVICDDCEGTSVNGVAAWTDIDIYTNHALNLAENEDQDAKKIVDVEGVSGVTQVANELKLSNAAKSSTAQNQIIANYQGHFEIAKLKVSCAGLDFRLAAYGTNLSWLYTDGIIEHLLQSDLSSLESAITSTRDEGWKSVNFMPLLQPLNYVISSEINIDYIDAEIEGKSFKDSFVTVEFSNRLKGSIYNALSLIYTRSAKNEWWKLLIATGAIDLAGTYFSNTTTYGLLAGGATITASWFIFRNKIAKIITGQLTNPDDWQRVNSIASKMKVRRVAALLLTAPSLALLAAIVALVPI